MMSNERMETPKNDTCITDASTRSFTQPSSIVHQPSPIMAWYPMYVSYHRELEVQKALDKAGVENFVPMIRVTERINKKIVHSLRPAIHNLIFVHSHRAQIRELKMFNRDCAPMQYMTFRSHDGAQPSEVITVPDRQMHEFMRAMAVDGADDHRTFLPFTDFIGKEGREATFVNGPFQGISGTVKRIGKNRFVVIVLQHVGALAITIDHSTDLQFTEE